MFCMKFELLVDVTIQMTLFFSRLYNDAYSIEDGSMTDELGRI
jgi:hypothetical protein